MRYKRLLVLFTCSIFLTALIVCFFSVFRVSEVNIYTTEIINSNENIKELVYENSKDSYGKNLFFLNQKDIVNKLNKTSPYINVKKVEKRYPNILEISVEERKEVYSIFYQNKFFVLDESFQVLAIKENNKNNIDSLENILLNLNVADFDYQTLKVGKKLKVYDKVSFECLSNLSNLIFENRANLKSVELTVKKDGHFMRELTLTFKEGLVIVLQSLQERSVDKFNSAIEYYLACENKGDLTKLYANIHIESGEIIITE